MHSEATLIFMLIFVAVDKTVKNFTKLVQRLERFHNTVFGVDDIRLDFCHTLPNWFCEILS